MKQVESKGTYVCDECYYWENKIECDEESCGPNKIWVNEDEEG